MSNSNSAAVTIAPEFFAHATRDYAEPGWALTRELVQNGKDAPGCTCIEIDHKLEMGADGFPAYVLTVTNGEPMSREILFDKFLALGGSAKANTGSVGGFGRAKELVLCQQSWEIETGEFTVVGVGGNYGFTEGHSHAGTRTRLVLTDAFSGLDYYIRKFLSLCEWDGSIFYNGERQTTNYKAGPATCEYDWGTVHLIDPAATPDPMAMVGMVVVRVQGIPMFSRMEGADTVIVEITKPSTSVLTSNRDAMVWPFYYEFDSFLRKLSQSRLDALKTKWQIKEWHGNKIKVFVQQEMLEAAYESGKTDVIEESEEQQESPAVTTTQLLMKSSLAASTVVKKKQAPHEVTVSGDELAADVIPHVLAANAEHDLLHTDAVVESGGHNHKIGYHFYTANNTGEKVPDWFTPTAMGKYCLKIATFWIETLIKIHGINGVAGEFSVGFVFSKDVNAMWDRKRRIFYINPVLIEENIVNGKKQTIFKKRFPTKADRYRLLSDAMHEFTHSLGEMNHNEAYANLLTKVTGKCLAHSKILTSHV